MNGIIYYLVICFSLTILYDLLIYHVFRERDLEKKSSKALLLTTISARMYIPFLTVLLIIVMSNRDFIGYVREWTTINYSIITISLYTPIYVYLALTIYILVGLVSRNIDKEKLSKNLLGENNRFRNILVLITTSYVAGITINAIYGFGEEIGWRTYLFIELYHYIDYWSSVIMVGIIWGIWHIPLYIVLKKIGLETLFTENMYYTTIYYIVFCLLLTIPMTQIMLKTHNIIPVSILHGSINSLWRSVELLSNHQKKTQTLINTFISWILTIIIIDIVLF